MANRLSKFEKISTKLHDVFISDSTGVMNRGIRHLLAGGTGTLLYIALIALFVEVVGFHPVYATIISFILLMVFIYTLNRAWVYNTATAHSRTLPRFLTVTAISLLLNTGIMYIIVERFNGWYGFGILFAALIVPGTNFMLNYFWAFK